MRVLITLDALGGTFTFAAVLIEALRREEVETVAVNLGPGLRAQQWRRLQAAGAVAVYETGHRLEWMADPFPELEAAAGWLRLICRVERVDLVHAGAYFCGGIGLEVPTVVTAHSCVLSWWRAVHGTAAPPEWRRYRALVERGLAGADAVVAPTEAMRCALLREYGPHAANVSVIHNGSARPLVPAGDKDPFVLGAGRLWDRGKNLEVLAEAARLCRHPVRIAGALEDHEPPAGPELLGELPASELAEVRRRAAVFASPARYEPFGLAVLEAAQDRCALVLSDIPSLRELWQGAAVFVAPEDPEAWAATFDTLLADPVRIDELGRLAQRRAKRYSAEATAAAYTRLYRSLCSDEHLEAAA